MPPTTYPTSSIAHAATRTGSPLPRAHTTLPARSLRAPGTRATSVSAIASSSPVTALIAPRRLASESSDGACARAHGAARASNARTASGRNERMAEIREGSGEGKRVGRRGERREISAGAEARAAREHDNRSALVFDREDARGEGFGIVARPYRHGPWREHRPGIVLLVHDMD